MLLLPFVRMSSLLLLMQNFVLPFILLIQQATIFTLCAQYFWETKGGDFICTKIPSAVPNTHILLCLSINASVVCVHVFHELLKHMSQKTCCTFAPTASRDFARLTLSTTLNNSILESGKLSVIS